MTTRLGWHWIWTLKDVAVCTNWFSWQSWRNILSAFSQGFFTECMVVVVHWLESWNMSSTGYFDLFVWGYFRTCAPTDKLGLTPDMQRRIGIKEPASNVKYDGVFSYLKVSQLGKLCEVGSLYQPHIWLSSIRIPFKKGGQSRNQKKNSSHEIIVCNTGFRSNISKRSRISLRSIVPIYRTSSSSTNFV